MGLLDSIAGAVMNNMGGESAGGFSKMALDLFNQQGGLAGVVSMLKEGGLGEQVASWVGTGENLSISPEQIQSVLGNSKIADMAAKIGITPEVLSAQFAEHLPGLINHLTPDGVLPEESSGLLDQVMGMFKG